MFLRSSRETLAGTRPRLDSWRGRWTRRGRTGRGAPSGGRCDEFRGFEQKVELSESYFEKKWLTKWREVWVPKIFDGFSMYCRGFSSQRKRLSVHRIVAQMVVTFVDGDVVIGLDATQPALVSPTVRPARRRFEVGSTHMVRVQWRDEDDGYGLWVLARLMVLFP